MGAKCPVVVRGQHFDSIGEAAEHFGVCRTTVSQMLARRGDLDRLGLPRVRQFGRKPARPAETVIFGVRFESRCAAARALGFDRKTIRKVVNGKAIPSTREAVYAALLRWQMKRDQQGVGRR